MRLLCLHARCWDLAGVFPPRPSILHTTSQWCCYGGHAAAPSCWLLRTVCKTGLECLPFLEVLSRLRMPACNLHLYTGLPLLILGRQVLYGCGYSNIFHLWFASTVGAATLAHVWGVCGACELAFGHSHQSSEAHRALVRARAIHKVWSVACWRTAGLYSACDVPLGIIAYNGGPSPMMMHSCANAAQTPN